jgi:hypothetical protein
VIRKWLSRRRMPDLGDIIVAAQNRMMVLADGEPHRVVYAERFPGAEHSKSVLEIVPWPQP